MNAHRPYQSFHSYSIKVSIRTQYETSASVNLLLIEESPKSFIELLGKYEWMNERMR